MRFQILNVDKNIFRKIQRASNKVDSIGLLCGLNFLVCSVVGFRL